MKRILLIIAAIAYSTSNYAVVIDGYDFNSPDTLEKLSKLTRSEVDALSPDVRREYFKRISALHSGGIVEKPGSGKGMFLFADSTGELTEAMLFRDLNILNRTLKISPKIIRCESVTVKSAKSKLMGLGGDAAVFIVNDIDLPRLITASEEGWAIVNIGKMKLDNPSTELLNKRITVEVIRGLAQIFGSGNSGLSMTAITSLKDIDELKHTGFPSSAIKLCQTQMKKLGFEPKVTASYRVACRQGWAPTPTNDVQKAIWNQVHATPKNPLKIEFDPKKGR